MLYYVLVMNPQSNEKPPAFTLPLPQGEAPQPTPEQSANPLNPTEVSAGKAIEQGISSAPMPPPSTGAAQQVPPAPAAPVPQAPGIAPSTMPQIADDTDLIEKEWVEKAKQIVAQTAHDPYLQNREINRVKADYLKKRYNKDVKLSEE